tara:strand:- start:323 stop:661 length:339 start_codon:yes stop_codon:yes gene_type:complete
MGYRSQVAIELEVKEKEILKTAIKYDENLKEIVDWAETKDNWDKKHPDLSCILSWDFIKWYEGNAYIDAMMSFLSHIDDESYKFIRVGEDFDDVEVSGCLWGRLDITRELQW